VMLIFITTGAVERVGGERSRDPVAHTHRWMLYPPANNSLWLEVRYTAPSSHLPGMRNFAQSFTEGVVLL